MTTLLKQTPYVRLYDADDNLVRQIEDQDTILALWRATDLWNREKSYPVSYGEWESGNVIVGRLDYLTELDSGDDKFYFPIYLYTDGRVQWWITPDSRHWYWSEDLKNEVEMLWGKYADISE